ncbi:MAG: hypothetical protein ACLFP4_08095 [Spirochaetales bacterium]
MRKALSLLLILMLSATAAFATPTLDDFQTGVEKFSEGVASSLPLNSVIGLNWSSAYIGQFPRFGVGASIGFSTVPYDAIQPTLQQLDIESNLASNNVVGYIQDLGAPLPAWALEARIGGFVIPFDVGVKFGTIPPSTQLELAGIEADFLLFGVDTRFRLIEEGIVLPAISAGVGYNRLRAAIGIDGITGSNYTLSFTDPRNGSTPLSITMEDPSVEYFWQANTIDLHAQASKSLLILTPYIGAGASIGFGRAGAALRSEVTTSGFSESEFDEINQAFEQGTDETLPKLGPQGIEVGADMPTGWAFRAFGGVSFNLLILKVDLTGMYDFLGGNFGVTLGTRIQF